MADRLSEARLAEIQDRQTYGAVGLAYVAIEELLAELLALRSERDEARQQLVELTADNERLALVESEWIALHEKLRMAERQIATLTAERDSLQGSLEEWMSDFHSMMAHHHATERSWKADKDALTALQGACEQLKAQHRQFRIAVTRLQTRGIWGHPGQWVSADDAQAILDEDAALTTPPVPSEPTKEH